MRSDLHKWKLNSRQARFFVYLTVLLLVAGWRYVPRPWKPACTITTAHFTVYSTATDWQTRDMAEKLEILYTAYSNCFSGLPTFDTNHPKLKVKLFKNREEFRHINPGLGWAEAFYRKTYCRAYFSKEEINPYHWMLHEAVHQLNAEVAHLHLAKWLSEGVAEYFSTSRITGDRLELGRIDTNTYPVWWIEELATSVDLEENLRNGSVIPLKAIVTNRGGPSMSREFNRYYLHWWTLTYFLFESPRHRDQALALVQRGGELDAFNQLLGPVDQVQTDWHTFVLQLKDGLSGKDLEFWKRQNPTVKKVVAAESRH